MGETETETETETAGAVGATGDAGVILLTDDVWICGHLARLGYRTGGYYYLAGGGGFDSESGIKRKSINTCALGLFYMGQCILIMGFSDP